MMMGAAKTASRAFGGPLKSTPIPNSHDLDRSPPAAAATKTISSTTAQTTHAEFEKDLKGKYKNKIPGQVLFHAFKSNERY